MTTSYMQKMMMLGSAKTLAQQVAALFSAGEQGAWYDPSDFSTMFQDAAGTTPVTAVGQAVGLLLDKSKGLVIGTQLVTNGTFDSNITGWTAGSAKSNISWNNGKLRVSTTFTDSVGKSAYQAFPVVAGKWYVITGDATLIKGTVTTVQVALRDGVSAESSAVVLSSNLMLHTVGSGSFYYYADSTRTLYLHCRIFNTTQPCTVDFDNVSAKEIVGNHATQTTDTKRPVLSARYNLLTKTEQFTDAYWFTNHLITANTTQAPNGTLTADTITSNGSQNNVRGLITSVSGINYKLSVSLKYINNPWIVLQLSDSGVTHRARVWFNIQTGSIGGSAVTGNAVVISSSIENEGNGWYRCTIIASNPVTFLYAYFPTLVTENNSLTIAANGQSAYLWGADLRPASDGINLPVYQRINTVTDYDTVGFPCYLLFDGIDDALQTASVNFTGTDSVTIWAGIHQLTDVFSVITELSTDRNLNLSAFTMATRSLNTPFSYGFYSKGTMDSLLATGPNYLPPITNTITAIGDISSDTNIIRANGVQVASLASDQGTGNYGNHPLYIGSRGGTVAPFNGRLYSLIIRGAQSTAAQITNTEAYVNSRTGAY